MNGKFPAIALDMLMLAAHALFIAGAVLLFVYSEKSYRPIHLEQTKLYQVISIYAIGYLAVFLRWLDVVASDELYLGRANLVPEYLTRKLWGKFPYLGSFGRYSNAGDKHAYWHKYQDVDVQGKKFSQIFCLHTNRAFLLTAALMSVLLPYVFLNQIAPSYLRIIFNSSTLFSVYLSFFIIVWLSLIAVVVLRAVLWVKGNFVN
jgi:hypothetical protein